MDNLNIIHFNVNGIRACIKKGFVEFIKIEKPDIICLNETKINFEFLEDELNEYKFRGYNFSKPEMGARKGYSGVAILSKVEPKNIIYGIENLEDSVKEGRVVTFEFEKFFLISVYTPNSKNDLSRLDFRENEWDKKFLKFMKKLEKKKPVIVGGDLNVAHKEIDLTNPKTNRKNPGFTDNERSGMDNFLENGFIDSFRYLHPNKIQYSWWSYFRAARDRNIGWRIDYFLTSEILKDKIKKAEILDKVLGSDHCPIKLVLEN